MSGFLQGAAPHVSLAALRRASWLLCVTSGLCLLVWIVWRVNAALTVPPQLNPALHEAAQRGSSEIRQHLQQAHQVLDGLTPRTVSAAKAGPLRWVQDPALFAPLGFALTRISPDIHFVYFDNLGGVAHGVENTADGFRFGGRALHSGAGGVFDSRRWLGGGMPAGATNDSRPGSAREYWYDAARRTTERVLSAAEWSVSRQQLEVTLSQAVYSDSRELGGVVGTDLSLKRLPALLGALAFGSGGLAYLVDADGVLLASTFDEPLMAETDGAMQRRKAAQSTSAVLRASDSAWRKQAAATAPFAPTEASSTAPLTRAQSALAPLLKVPVPGVTARDFVAVRQAIDVPSGPAWQLVLLAPQRDVANPMGTHSDWLGLCLALLTGLSLTSAVVIWHVEHDVARAQLALRQSGLSTVPVVTRDSPFVELARLSGALRSFHQDMVLARAALDLHQPADADADKAVDSSAARLAELQAELDVRTHELAAASERAVTAARSRAAFLAVISHEFRTPLNGASGMTALLADTPLTPKQRGYVDALTESSGQLQLVLDEIIDFCRAEEGDVALQNAPFNVRSVLDQVCDTAANTAMNKGLDFTVDVAGSVRDAAGYLQPWVVQGDAGCISKVVVTLIHNAIKFTDMGGVRVTVRPTVMDGTDDVAAMEVRVRDSGPGMTSAQQAVIFRPFTQLDSSISRRHGGTGLGLAICKRLAGLMGGVITVDSEPGQGSMFRFIVPAPVVDAQTLPGELMPLDGLGLDGARRSSIPALFDEDTQHDFRESVAPSRPLQRVDITVLVVDDNEINLKVVSAVLTKFGYSVRTASGGRDAIDQVDQAIARHEKIDVVLMDVHMPGVDGIQATQAIVAQYGSDAPPIIALTADVSGQYVERCLEAGMVDYLTKPLQPWALAQSLLRWVGVSPATASPIAAQAPVAPTHPAMPRQESAVATHAPAPRPRLAAAAEVGDELAMPLGLVDLDRLNDFREFDDSQFTITHEVINLLFKEVPVKFGALEQAVANDDVAALISAAHSLRGVSGHVGAVVVQHLCAVLERSAIKAERVPDDASACLQALRSAWSRTRPLLEDWR